MLMKNNRGLTIVDILVFAAMAYGGYYLWTQHAAKSSASAPAAPEKLQIVMYTSASCEPCDRARTWLNQRHYAFEERNAEVYGPELEKLGSRIVPVIVVNGEAHYGFASATLDATIQAVLHPRKP